MLDKVICWNVKQGNEEYRVFQCIFTCSNHYSQPRKWFKIAVKWCICSTINYQFFYMIFNTLQITVKLNPAHVHVQNHVEELKHYCDVNRTFKSC